MLHYVSGNSYPCHHLEINPFRCTFTFLELGIFSYGFNLYIGSSMALFYVTTITDANILSYGINLRSYCNRCRHTFVWY